MNEAPPKKTGKAGIGPVEDDFFEPNVIPGTEAAEMLSEQAAEAGTEDTEQAEQLELEGTQVDVPLVVRNNKLLCEFVRPHFERDSDGARSVGFEFSFPLVTAHQDYLPREILMEWDHLRQGNASLVKCRGVRPQNVTIGLVPDDPDNDLILVAARIERPVLAEVEEKGSGKKSKVIRLTFRAVVDQIDAVARFAVDHHGDVVWISLETTQGSLLT